MRTALLGIYILIFSGVITAQQYMQLNGGMAAGSFQVSFGGQLDYYIKKENNWTRGITYQHQLYAYTAATDQLKTEFNYNSLFAGVGYEANVNRWSSFIFSLGAGVSHVYNEKENHFGPAMYGQFYGLIHLGERTSLMLPLLILPKSGLLSWLPSHNQEMFYRVELFPVGLRMKL